MDDWRWVTLTVLLVLFLLLPACTAPTLPTNQPTTQPPDPPLANLQTCRLADSPTCTKPLMITPATRPWPFDRFILSEVEGLRTGV